MSFSEIIKKNSELPIPVKWWTKFAFHYTDITNALSILQEGVLYSRLDAQSKHLMKNDNASYQVIDITSLDTLSYVRFYFRPLTPTQYNNEGYKHPSLRFSSDAKANVPIPIFFAFNLEKLLTDPKVMFSEMTQAGAGSPRFSGEEHFARLPFEKIYSDGYVEDDIRKYRHAELLYPNSYPINNSLEAILCRNEFEQSMLLSLLRKSNEKLFYKYKPIIKVCREKMFEKNGLFIQDINLDGNKISIMFANNYNKNKYDSTAIKKLSSTQFIGSPLKFEPLKAVFIFEWKTNKTILHKASVNADIDYFNIRGCVFTLPLIEKASIVTITILCNTDLIGYKEFMLTNIF